MSAPTLINCTIRHNQWYTVPDGGDGGADTDVVPLIGTVKFIPQIHQAALADQYAVQLGTITGYIDTDGQLKAKKGGTVGVRLIANDPVLNLQYLPYKVEFSLTTTAGQAVPVEGVTFSVPDSDETVWLSAVLPAPGLSAVAVVPGSGSIARFVKDPDAVLDYRIDWAPYLGGETIDTVECTASGDLDVDSSSHTGTTTTMVLSGGTAGLTYTVVTHIGFGDGLEDDRTVTIVVKDL